MPRPAACCNITSCTGYAFTSPQPGATENDCWLKTGPTSLVKYRAGFHICSGLMRPPPPPPPPPCSVATNAAKYNSVWMGGTPDWASLQIHLGSDPAAALRLAEGSLDRYRSELRDQWNIHGLTANDGYGVNGQPWCTAHCKGARADGIAVSGSPRAPQMGSTWCCGTCLLRCLVKPGRG